MIAWLHKLAANGALECTIARFNRRVEMLDWLCRLVKVTGYNEDKLLLACNEIDEPLLQRLKKIPLAVVAVYADVEGI
jgi:hypothetical protein